MKYALSPLILTLALAELAHGQDVLKMRFVLGEQQRQLSIEVQYHDPGEINDQLKGSRVLPFKFSASNLSSQAVPLNYEDIRLNLDGNRLLTPSDPSMIAEEIRAGGRLPKLMNFLAGQSSTFHRTELEKTLLQDGLIPPGKKKEGFIYFLKPDGPDAGSFNGIMWLEPKGYPPQVLETKDVTVKTAPKPATTERIRQAWETVKFGPLPYKKSYALLIGIGKYQYLPPLSSPALDVRKVEKFLLAQGFDEVITIEDETVKASTFQSPQKYFNSKIQPDDRFLFYYSGHGLTITEGNTTKGYIPLANERPQSHNNSVAMDDLLSWLKRVSPKHLLVILDACFSGLVFGRIETHSPEEVMRVLALPPARYALTAGTERQETLAHQKWNGSLFTEMIIRGVQKAKFQTDRNSGGDAQLGKIVAISALYAWVRPNVSVEATRVNRELTPLLKDLSDPVSKGEFIFFRQ